MENARIPFVGEIIKFFDDGKIAISRRHWAVVLDVIPSEIIEKWEPKLYETWQQIVSKEEFYSCITDYFIFCDIPTYDKEKVIFVRTNDGQWFSIDYPNDWMSGLLDVDDIQWKKIQEIYGDEYFLPDKDERNWYKDNEWGIY